MPADNRWYDQKPQFQQAIRIFMLFPDQVQSIIGEGIARLAEKECHAHELVKHLKSLGVAKVLALYQAKQKRRSYDNSPVVHQAMNYLTLLSDEERDDMSARIIELTGMIVNYLEHCRTIPYSPTMSEIEAITQVYVDSGADQARELLTTLKEILMRKIESRLMIVDETIRHHGAAD